MPAPIDVSREPEDKTVRSLHLSTAGDAVTRAIEELRSACREHGVGERDLAALELICDELVSNVSHHAYGDEDGPLELEIELDETRCILTLTDQGPPFDPSRRADPDVDVPLEEREIGGLGILLVREQADRMEYRRRDDQNMLRIERRLDTD